MSVCAHQGDIERKPMVIMLAMDISFSMLKAWQACIACSMSLIGSGSMQVGGESSLCRTEIGI